MNNKSSKQYHFTISTVHIIGLWVQIPFYFCSPKGSNVTFYLNQTKAKGYRQCVHWSLSRSLSSSVWRPLPLAPTWLLAGSPPGRKKTVSISMRPLLSQVSPSLSSSQWGVAVQPSCKDFRMCCQHLQHIALERGLTLLIVRMPQDHVEN